MWYEPNELVVKSANKALEQISYKDKNGKIAYSRKSLGKCGIYVRQALECGFDKPLTRHLSAKDYGSSLIEFGFKKVFAIPLEDELPSGYGAQIGDVCIIQYEPHGHICIYTSKGWVSDFLQLDYYGGSIRKQNPSHAMYRFTK